MRTQHFPWNYDLAARFPERQQVLRYEGGNVTTAESNGKGYIIVDDGTMADFLIADDPVDAEVLARLKTVIEFDSVGERDHYLAGMVAEHEAARRQPGDRGNI